LTGNANTINQEKKQDKDVETNDEKPVLDLKP
jgi:hypothetical protein